MAAFEVDVDGRILGEMEALRAATGWMMRHYRDDVSRNGGGNRVLFDFIVAAQEAVRVREVVPPSELAEFSSVRVEVSVKDAASVMGCSPEFVRRLARQGRVGARRIGPVWVIDITNYLED